MFVDFGRKRMNDWAVFPKNSWIPFPSGIHGTKLGAGQLLASYAVNKTLPTTLNGELSASFEISNWKNLGAAGLVCRADETWSFVALHIFAREVGSGAVQPVLTSFCSGHPHGLAIGKEKIALEHNRCEMKLAFRSGFLRGEIRSGQNVCAAQAIATASPFAGLVGVVKFYECKVKCTDLKLRILNSTENHIVEKSEFEWDVFLSHSSADKEKVVEIAAKIKAAGLRVWLDAEQIDLGDHITAKIEHGLAKSKKVLVCLSPALGKSNWCRAEYGPYLNDEISRQTPARVIPLVIETVSIDNIPVFLRDKLRVDYRSTHDWDRLLGNLRAGGPGTPMP